MEAASLARGRPFRLDGALMPATLTAHFHTASASTLGFRATAEREGQEEGGVGLTKGQRWPAKLLHVECVMIERLQPKTRCAYFAPIGGSTR